MADVILKLKGQMFNMYFDHQSNRNVDGVQVARGGDVREVA